MFSTAYIDQFGLCRLCLVREEVNIPIFENKGGNFPFINTKINTCLPVKVDKHDKLPKKICVDCFYKLESFYQFYNVTADAEKQLKSWIEDENSSAPEMQEEEKIHLTKKLQQKANKPVIKENTESTSGNVEAVNEISIKEELKTGRDSDLDIDHFTAGTSFQDEESDEEILSESKKMIAKTDNPEKVPKKSTKKVKKMEIKAKTRIIVKRGKRLKRVKYFYKKIKENEYACLDCEERFQTLKKLEIHFKAKHTEKNIFKCNLCEKTFTKAPEFKTHRKEEHKIDNDDLIFSCNKCNYVASRKRAIEIHQARKHSNSYDIECDICKKKFKTKGDVRLHIPTHDETGHMCDICGQFYPSEHSLVRHRRVRHINVYNFRCPVCKLKLISQENLDNHIRENHNPEAPITCEECGLTFKRRDYLNRHEKRMHKKIEKPHLCSLCGKSFICMNTYRIHYLTHTKIRPYVCNVCGSTFSQRSAMMLHWKKKHPDAGEPPPPLILSSVFEMLNLDQGSNPEWTSAGGMEGYKKTL